MRRQAGPIRLPPARAGLRIGLYGGSFDPPHPGHRHVALAALRRLGLDRVWWIVSPGNPLKDHAHLAAAATRLAQTRRLARHPRMDVTAFEAELGSPYTADTLAFLRRRNPRVRFVWIMGADSFASLPRWRHWRRIAADMPLAVVDRPGWTLRATAGRAAGLLGSARIAGAAGGTLAGRRPPAWVLLYGPRSHLSSTGLRGRSAKLGPSIEMAGAEP